MYEPAALSHCFWSLVSLCQEALFSFYLMTANKKEMLAIEKFPQGISDDIFKYLNRSELLSFASTCKKWYTAFRHHFYVHVSLNDLHMLQDFVSTLIEDPPLGGFVRTVTIPSSVYANVSEGNAYYDTIIALIQQTPFIESIRADGSIRCIIRDILLNTCNAGHWDYLKNLNVKSFCNTFNFDYETALASTLMRVRISSENRLKIVDSHSRLEVNKIDSIINQYPEASILKLNFYRLTDWNKAIDQVNPCLNITRLIVDTPWVTDALLQYICLRFVNVQHLKLVQQYNPFKMDHYIQAETLERFASYLNNMACFEVTLTNPKSGMDIQLCFNNILNSTNTDIYTIENGLALYMKRPSKRERIRTVPYSTRV
ncbi:hypothetical protein EDC96DRAFT_543329 [Choanephora cucurbitarum]|nr:hypothetical protein EDC96DRAFT_543329 [Choanephora cucurbitarum]